MQQPIFSIFDTRAKIDFPETKAQENDTIYPNYPKKQITFPPYPSATLKSRNANLWAAMEKYRSELIILFNSPGGATEQSHLSDLALRKVIDDKREVPDKETWETMIQACYERADAVVDELKNLHIRSAAEEENSWTFRDYRESAEYGDTDLMRLRSALTCLWRFSSRTVVQLKLAPDEMLVNEEKEVFASKMETVFIIATKAFRTLRRLKHPELFSETIGQKRRKESGKSASTSTEQPSQNEETNDQAMTSPEGLTGQEIQASSEGKQEGASNRAGASSKAKSRLPTW